MQLTEKQIKDLKKYSLVLNSLNMEDGVYWSFEFYDGQVDNDELNGPYYKGRFAEDLTFLPESIKYLFETIKNNFDTGNFYNEYYDNESGGLNFGINAETKEIIISYTYTEMITEESSVEKNFSEFSNMAPGWNSSEREVKKLNQQNFLDELISEYGNSCEVSYDGGGDSGWINDVVETSNGEKPIGQLLEYISYDMLEVYYGGWEINEGSNGSIKYDFKNKTVKINHYQNVEDNIEQPYMTLKF